MAYRSRARARAFSASTSRFFGGAAVTRSSSRCRVMCAISWTARSKVSWFTCDGFVVPLPDGRMVLVTGDAVSFFDL